MPFKLILSLWSFPDAAWHVRLQKIKYKSEMRIQLLSPKPDIKDICKNIKQWHVPQIFIL